MAAALHRVRVEAARTATDVNADMLLTSALSKMAKLGRLARLASLGGARVAEVANYQLTEAEGACLVYQMTLNRNLLAQIVRNFTVDEDTNMATLPDLFRREPART